MARTNRTYSHGANVSADEGQLPRYFAKTGHFDQDPTKVKKDGHGKGNWGKEGDELHDIADEFNFHHERRHSNSAHPSAQQEFGRMADRHTMTDEAVFEEDND